MDLAAQRYRKVIQEYPHLPFSDRAVLAQAAIQGRTVRELRIIAHSLMGWTSRVESP